MTDLDGKKLQFGCKKLSEISYVNINVSVDTKEASGQKNKIIDHIIKNLSANNNRYYIKHKEVSYRFKIFEDPQQKDKDRLIELIFNMKKNQADQITSLKRQNLNV